jgi:DNA (cytosine-5)-methyltransferase 1
MWPEAIRAVRELEPKVFLFENVRGLLRPAFSQYLAYLQLQLSWPEIKQGRRNWKEQLKKLEDYQRGEGRPSYSVVVKGINAADYGAAQKRHRAIIMGVRSDIANEVTFPAPTHSREALVWEKWVTGKYWKHHGILQKSRSSPSEFDRRLLKRLLETGVAPTELPWRTVRDAIGDLPTPSLKKESISNHLLHPGARLYAGHTGSPWDEPAKALKAGNHGVPGGENTLIDDNGSARYFTVREMARLQGMPDDFDIDGSWMSSTKQLGNAVPTEIGKIFGKALRERLLG